jgi:hypothetical protein
VGGFGPAGERAAAVEDGGGIGRGGVGGVGVVGPKGDAFGKWIHASFEFHARGPGEPAGGAEAAEGVARARERGPGAGGGGVGAGGGEAKAGHAAGGAGGAT